MPEEKKVFHVSAKYVFDVGRIEKAGLAEGEDAVEALERFLREKFRNPDGKPVTILHLTEIKVELA